MVRSVENRSDPSPRGGRRERKKLAVRRALGSAAIRLAVERGLENVTIEDITAGADVSLRTFGNYFSSKYEAICAIGSDRARRIGAELLGRRRPARAAPTPAAAGAGPARDGPRRGCQPVPDRGRVQSPGPARDFRAERALVRASGKFCRGCCGTCRRSLTGRKIWLRSGSGSVSGAPSTSASPPCWTGSTRRACPADGLRGCGARSAPPAEGIWGLRIFGQGRHIRMPIHPCRFGTLQWWIFLPTRLAVG